MIEKYFTKHDIKKQFDVESVSDICFNDIEEEKLRYFILGGGEKETAILQQFKRLKEDKKQVATPERTEVWENGWSENYEEFKATLDLSSLTPKYFSVNECRYNQEFVKGDGYAFNDMLQRIIRKHIFTKYMAEFSNIYEFGCGTAFNLVDLAKIYPDKSLYGFDLTYASGKIIKLIKEHFGYNIEGGQFDFTKPDESIKIERNSCIYTFGALEQTYDKWSPFLDFIIARKPELCIHLEPIEEFYDEDNILDYLALEFHRKRHYLKGFYTRLKELEQDGVIEIIEHRRLFYGSCNDETSGFIVWRVK